ncbi:hypothetical protein ACFW9V_02245 [Streptomyces hygroscopicus]|uniref:hypothetical protein n=1 Tax=Streptomyces hygroscopicus TaxID=1912 RepID=UPI00367FB4E1
MDEQADDETHQAGAETSEPGYGPTDAQVRDRQGEGHSGTGEQSEPRQQSHHAGSAGDRFQPRAVVTTAVNVDPGHHDLVQAIDTNQLENGNSPTA